MLDPPFHASPRSIAYPSSAPSHPTGTAKSTGSIITSTATPTPTPSIESFHLVVADTGTRYDGDYLSIGSHTVRNGRLVPYAGEGFDEATSFSTFNISADGTLQNEVVGGIADVFPGGAEVRWFFGSGTIVDESGNTETVCELSAGP